MYTCMYVYNCILYIHTLHYITLHSITLHYIHTYITLHMFVHVQQRFYAYRIKQAWQLPTSPWQCQFANFASNGEPACRFRSLPTSQRIVGPGKKSIERWWKVSKVCPSAHETIRNPSNQFDGEWIGLQIALTNGRLFTCWNLLSEKRFGHWCWT